MADEVRKPDAIRCPTAFPADPKVDRDVARNALFGPVLGVKRVFSRALMDRQNESFVTPTVDSTINYPHGHPNALQDRYDWFVAGRDKDGKIVPVMEETGDPTEAKMVKLGYLKHDEYADDPQAKADIEAAYAKRLAAAKDCPKTRADLVARGILLPGEVAAAPATDSQASPAAPAVPVRPTDTSVDSKTSDDVVKIPEEQGK